MVDELLDKSACKYCNLQDSRCITVLGVPIDKSLWSVVK